MKPIALRLSGLQSYREAQEVDFERLCEAGVFGIFGPTGSGKSSILDAVTLALYGKVERASGGTQGIMNQSEKTLAVAFTFDLEGGGERKRFRVERQFKRGGEVSVNNTVCRFIEVTEAGDHVLADKLADVNRCVEEQIGLNMQDFTRAVVLPQGKFAEFLSLTGKDRRSMLQRLFRLERFGDGLALKLNQRMKAAEASLQEAAAEQLGLGDASAAAVEAAAVRYREAATESAAARAALAEAERLHAERLHVRERLTALRGKEALQAKLQADAPRVAELERELQRLAAAERLLPALAAASAAEAALRAAASRREAAGLAHAARLEAAAAAAAEWTAAAAAAAAGEPRLALRLDQLAGAQRLEREAAELAADAAAIELRVRDASERRRVYGEQAAKAQEMLGRATAKQAELRAELKAVELVAEDRERRGKLMKRLQHYNQLASQAALVGNELAAASETSRQAEQSLSAIRLAHANALAAVREQTGLAQPLEIAVSLLEQRTGELDGMIPAWLERVRRSERERQRQQLAAQLAHELLAGEACPVCGSVDHNGGHAPTGDAGAGDGSELREWEALGAKFQRLGVELSPLHLKAGAVTERLIETLQNAMRNAMQPVMRTADGEPAQAGQLPERQSEVDANTDHADRTSIDESGHRFNLYSVPEAAAAGESGVLLDMELPETLDAEDANQSPETALAHYAQAMSVIRTVMDTHGQRLAAVEQESAGARSRLADAARRLELAAAACATQSALVDRAAKQAERCRAELERETAQWEAEFGTGMNPDKAEVALQELDKREAAADDLRSRLERSVTYIEETARTEQESNKIAQAAQLEAVELAATLGARQEQAAEKRSQIAAVTNGLPSAELIRQAEQELAALRAANARLTQLNEAAQLALQQAAEQRTGAVEAERSAADRQRETAAQWEASLEASPFASAEEVAALQPLLSQQAAMADVLARHREEEQQLAAQIGLLRDQLGGRSLTEEEWSVSVETTRRARAENELLLQTAAKAERDLESLRSKQERWNALETTRLRMERLTGRLKSLQTIFRGNAFVEYVAEEQLIQVCRAASERLGFLTKRRYALEVDSGGGFVIRDDAGGGIRRPVSTLSGGETFLASLALALALSGQIQLRGKYPLQFFFLDEGFGTLDPELLDTVITSLEKLHHETLAVGVISHVPELRARLPRRLIVTPSEPFGRGSTVELETM